jgi:hypothetical protein
MVAYKLDTDPDDSINKFASYSELYFWPNKYRTCLINIQILKQYAQYIKPQNLQWVSLKYFNIKYYILVTGFFFVSDINRLILTYFFITYAHWPIGLFRRLREFSLMAMRLWKVTERNSK